MEGTSVEGYYDTRWLTELWSTQAKVQGIMLKAARHCSSNISIVNNPLGQPGCTTLYVGLQSMWGSVYGDHIFSPCFKGDLPSWGL